MSYFKHIRSVEIESVPFDISLGSTGDGKAHFRIPAELDGMDLVSIGAQMGNAVSTSGAIDIQIARIRLTAPGTRGTAVDMLSTSLTIDANEYDSKDAATPAVINTSNDDVVEGDLLRIDFDGVGTDAEGLYLTLGFV